MKLKSIKIENYKSFGEENNILILDDLNTIIGKNESGKSNLIECMAGIRYDQLNLIKRAKTMLKVRSSQRLENLLTINNLTNVRGDDAYNFSQNVLKFLR
jgi:recombinational DNA repair ATPase RecF